MKALAAASVAVIVLACAAHTQQASPPPPRLSQTQPVVLGEIIALEVSSTLSSLLVATDEWKTPALTSYDRETGKLLIRIYTPKKGSSSSAMFANRREGTLDQAKRRIEEFRGDLLRMAIETVSSQRGDELTEEDFVIQVLQKGEVILTFEDGGYTIPE